MYIPIILGTAREGRNSEKVANFVLGEVKKYGLETEIIDVKNFGLSKTDNTTPTPDFKEKITRADGVIVVTPEYNHSIPGELKLTLDQLYKEYFHKPLGICGVSMGPLGGARAVEQLRLIAVELHMIPIREAVYFSLVTQLFDSGGKITDRAFEGRIKTMLDELTAYAKKLAGTNI
jgi:NAD(P)H-dependent FMN reductase